MSIAANFHRGLARKQADRAEAAELATADKLEAATCTVPQCFADCTLPEHTTADPARRVRALEFAMTCMEDVARGHTAQGFDTSRFDSAIEVCESLAREARRQIEAADRKAAAVAS